MGKISLFRYTTPTWSFDLNHADVTGLCYRRTAQAGYLKMLRVLRHFPKEYREAQISRIHRLNFNLDKVVAGSPPIIRAPGVSKRAYTKPNNIVMGQYHRVRMHAVMVYKVLSEKLQAPTCLCKVCSRPAS